MFNTVVVDDQKLMRSGLCALLRGVDEIEIVGEAGCCEELSTLVRGGEVDLVVMEWNLPGIGGLEVISRLSKVYPKLKILVVTGYTDDPFPARLVEAGARGLISKRCEPEELAKGIRAVLKGELYVCTEIAQTVATSLFPSQKKKSPFQDLSNRELQVMLMAVRGLRVQDISDRLCLSPKTVSTYRYRMFEKLGVKGEVELTRLAMRYGMMDTATLPVGESPVLSH